MDNKIINEVDSRKCNSCTTKTCVPYETVIYNVRLAQAFVPYQKLCSILCPLAALKIGTIFPELYSPYVGMTKKCKQHRNSEEEKYTNE